MQSNQTEVLSFTLSHNALEVLIRESARRGVSMSDVIERWAANEELATKNLKQRNKGKHNVNLKVTSS